MEHQQKEILFFNIMAYQIKKYPMAERSKTKWGKYTIGSGIKIISEEKARKLNPDYFFVMPYGFINEFLIREKVGLKKVENFYSHTQNLK